MSFFTRQSFAPPNCNSSRPQLTSNNSNNCNNSSIESFMPHGSAGIMNMPQMLPFPPSRLASSVHYSEKTGNNAAGIVDYSEELWKACAGPLVYVPEHGERVWYFPQGHMEQVAASTQQGLMSNCGQLKLPNSGLVSQILCRVVHRVLSAEKETDEVYAQISLLPESNDDTVVNGGGGTDQEDKLQASPSPQVSSVSSPAITQRPKFMKILTASDTSTHGGFSVLRKHAEECLPPLDMNQDTPSQELTATDLHGHEWKFRHTYRGHPRRHLLTTGWSVFVSHKKLLAGDAVIFLRGANGELRVGIRRAKRQQTVQQAVMSSHSMHMGVVATASHALGTRTMFSVYYKPRVSLSPFLVSASKFAEASSVSLSVGMRFKMKFETEDTSDRSYAGTITGIEDLDPINWPTSKWRSLKVNWDEIFNNERQDRVSPWEIELCVSSPVANPPSQVRSKRFRPTPSTELPGLAKGSTESMYSPKLPRVLQGQEPRNIGMSTLWKSSHGALNNHQNISIQQSQPQQNQQLAGPCMAPPSLQHRSSFYNPFISPESDLKLSVTCPTIQNSSANGGLNNGHGSLQGSSWPSPPSNDKWLMSLLPPHASPSTPIRHEKSLVTGNVLPSQSLLVQNQHHNPLPYPNLSAFGLWEASKQEKGPVSIATDVPPSPVVAESGCKIFGISLMDSPNVAKGNKHNNTNNVQSGESDEDQNKGEQSQAMEPEMPRSDATSDQFERLDQSTVESRIHSTRSCTKVIKKGSMVGRGIDLTRFDSYTSLFQELEAMFHMEGELTNPEKGWQVAYFDGDGDTMKVGDDPWPEFCSMVKKLYILSPEEVDAGQAIEKPK